jgi:hypothetical protein
MGLNVRFVAPPCAALLLALFAGAAVAESPERSSFDFDSLKQRFEREEAQRQADGIVLERLRDRQGVTRGRLSLGGDASHPDPYAGTAAAVNFRGRSDEELGGGIINFRLSF